MAQKNEFTGFSKEAVKFFRDLAKNNSKDWFNKNREVYDNHVMFPAAAFVTDMGKRIKFLSSNIVADPRRDKSIFRLNRDTRFSINKAPYKAHLGIYFWEGKGKKLENPGFYFQFDAEKILIGVGMHMFPKQFLVSYRDSVVHPKYGKELTKIVNRISKNKSYELGWEKYKKVPAGYDKNHPKAEYLLFGGFGFLYEAKHPKEFYSKDLISYCFKIFKDMSPVHFWLVDIIKRPKN